MGTEIELTVGGVSLDFSKNHMGIDHGFLFQESDRTRCHSQQIDYDYSESRPEEDLAQAEAAFIRPLSRVLPRLDIAGYTIDAARAEYEAVVGEALEQESEYASVPADGFMSFDEFCEFCGRFSLDELETTYIEYEEPDRDHKSQGRFASKTEEMQRIPNSPAEIYWSERSFFGSSVAILSPYSMLQVFGKSFRHADAAVVWQYGPLVDSGWAEVTDFNGGARRLDTVLVATEGSSDARILKRALEVLQPDVADFFRFIDVNERHHFWGAGPLTKFAEGLVRIDFQNKILFVLDNDAEGLEAYRRLIELKMPTNMRAMTLPELECFRLFLARGPEGMNFSDINRRAAGIECYLDLSLPNCPPAQIIWTNYKIGLDTWHGALEHKDSYAKHFYEQNDADLIAGNYDTTKLQEILYALLQQATSFGISEMVTSE
ncbi:MAG: HEPN/Toprim-associated domain-containing protein [Pseudomonadota bacterium]